MPYKDLKKEKENAKKRKRRYLNRKHIDKFGFGIGDMRGKHENHVKGLEHYRWNEGRMVTEDGYVLIRVGKSHPLADSNGYAYEHLLVWVSAGNHLPNPNELLHHDDECRSNNRIENLKLKLRGPHNSLHIAIRGRDDKGHFLPSKKAAGRLLDGRTWDELSEIK